MPLQAKLLRVLQEGTVRRIGARNDTRVDVRIVAATAQSLAPPRFRDDLYYRLAVVHLHVPPLRERPEDVPLLVDHLLEALCARMRLPRPRVEPEAARALLAHPWPGNVRQLENALERALLVCDGDRLRLDDLPAELRVHGAGARPTADEELSIPVQVAALERRLIERALTTAEGNKAAASRLLCISYKTLLYKIREYGLEP
jgi:two-component system response regulator AtoC